MPKVSICIPAYEEPETLKILLDSILVQTFTDYEVIITDDSSTHYVENVVAGFIGQGRIKYYRNREALGSPENWNEAIRKATGEYIKIMHHDDWFANEESLFQYVNMLDANNDVQFAFSASNKIDGSGHEIGIHTLSESELKLVSEHPDTLYYRGLSIGAPSAAIFRNGLGIVFDKNLKWLVDIDFYIRVLKKNKNLSYSTNALVCVSDLSKQRVTRVAQNSAQINLIELVHVYKKLETKNLSDYKYFIFILSKLVQFNVKNKNQLAHLGIGNNIPKLFSQAVLLSNVLVNLKQFLKAHWSI